MRVKEFEKIVKKQTSDLKRKWRKVVTGDENKRVRDHLYYEKKDKPQYIKLFDKIFFTMGILHINICQYFLFNEPTRFYLWYSFVIPVLLVIRFFLFKQKKLQYFLLDFCYYTQLFAFACIYVFPKWLVLFKVFFIFANGPLTWAIVIWRNSLVYHDFDRSTSIFIHILPAMLSYCLRLNFPPEARISGRDVVLASVWYIVWQTSYFVKTEILDRRKLDSDPELLTSLRWLTTDKKNDFANVVIKFLKTIRILKKDEELNPSEFKTKLIFMIAQFIYTLITFSTALPMFRSRTFQLVVITVIFIASVYNGASYYIEVFSQRYQLKFNTAMKVAEAAASAAYEIGLQTTPAAAELTLNDEDLTDLKANLNVSENETTPSKAQIIDNIIQITANELSCSDETDQTLSSEASDLEFVTVSNIDVDSDSVLSPLSSDESSPQSEENKKND